MVNTFKLALATNTVAGSNQTIYTCPPATTAVVKSIIAAHDALAATSMTTKIGIKRMGNVTPMTGNITVASSAGVNMLAGTLTMEAGDKIVAQCSATTFVKPKSTAGLTGTLYSLLRSGTTWIASTSTGIYRSTDGENFLRVNASMNTAFPTAKIGTDWFIYTSQSAAKRSADDGLTWSNQVVTNAPDAVTSNAATAHLIHNGTVWGGLNSSGRLTTTSDGITWTLATACPAAAKSLTWTGMYWIASRAATAADIYYSTGGVSWTTVAAISGFITFASLLISDGAGAVVAIGDSGTSAYSTDHGLTWAAGSYTSGAPTGGIWTGSAWLVKGGTTACAVSTDGLLFSPLTLTTIGGLPMVVDGSQVLLGGNAAIYATEDLICTPNNGMNYVVSLMEVA